MITSAFASAFADAMEHEARTLGRASTTTIGTMILSTMDEHRGKHLGEVLDWIKHQAHGV
jgi:hypothetical protein